jgi:hypothetical protein
MAEDNRRRYPRYRHRIPVQVTVGKRSDDATTADVSQQGVFVHLPSAPPMRSLVRLRFMMPDGAVDAVAVVVRVVHPNSEAEAVGVGVQFITMDPAQEKKWNAMLGQLKATQITTPMATDLAPRTSTGTQMPAVTSPAVVQPPPASPFGTPRTNTATRLPAVGAPPEPAQRTATGTRMMAVGPPVVGGMAVVAPSPSPLASVSAVQPVALDAGVRAFTATLVFRIRPGRIEDVADLFNLDMSSGAIMVDGVPLLEPGTVVKVEVTHPVTGSVMPLEASVFARLPQGGLALSLAPLVDTQRKALAVFLAERAPAQAPMRSLPPLPPLRPVTAPTGEVP